MDALTADRRLDRWCDAQVQRRLQRRVDEGLRRARATGTASLVSVSWRMGRRVDPSAVTLATRAPSEPWFCLEQPERDAIAIAGLGCVTALEADGDDRFAVLARRWRELARTALYDELAPPPGAGLTAVGGFAFAPTGARDPAWRGFAAASLQVPTVSLARRAAATWITVNAEIAPDDTADDVLGALRARLAGLEESPLPLVDPAPAGRYEVSSAMPPAHFEEVVGR
ncbi:MAG: isochorismate synthase, partial [Solirubrobacteraceae bacterium]